MMECQLCGDLDGPWELEVHKNRVVLVCEKCAKEIRKERFRNYKPKKKYNLLCYTTKKPIIYKEDEETIIFCKDFEQIIIKEIEEE